MSECLGNLGRVRTRHLPFDRLHNLRDLGGYAAVDGRSVAWGRLYRADSLAKLAGADWDRFLALGIRSVIDLRHPWEIDATGRVPESDRFSYINVSIEHRPYDQAEIDPGIDPWRFLADRYAEVATDGVVEIRQAIEMIATGGAPVMFHCSSGKDRTGLLAALVLTLLGVDEADIVADFALTDRAADRQVADWRAAHPDRALHWPAYGRAPAAVMQLALADLAREHGSVRRYLDRHMGIPDHIVTSLRHRYLTPRA